MLQPRIKLEHQPFRIAGQRIRIGGNLVGPGATIPDPTGTIWTLMQAMDGTRTPEQIVADVTARHPELSEAAVTRGIATLTAAGHVEDAAGPVPAEITSEDIDRYGRLAGYLGWIDPEPRASPLDPIAMLRQSTVTIIGLGGTGAAAAQALTASGIGALHLVDSDRVELSNLSRQVLYAEKDIGQPKVLAAAGHLGELNSTVMVTCQQRWVTSVADVRGLARSCDVLLLAADTPPDLRVWANRACFTEFTPWVCPGYQGPVAAISSFVPGEGPCWECLRDTGRKPELEPLHPEDLDAAVPFAPSSAMTSGISGALAATHVIALLTGIPAVTPGTAHLINLAAPGATVTITGRQQDGCQVCQ